MQSYQAVFNLSFDSDHLCSVTPSYPNSQLSPSLCPAAEWPIECLNSLWSRQKHLIELSLSDSDIFGQYAYISNNNGVYYITYTPHDPCGDNLSVCGCAPPPTVHRVHSWHSAPFFFMPEKMEICFFRLTEFPFSPSLPVCLPAPLSELRVLNGFPMQF